MMSDASPSSDAARLPKEASRARAGGWFTREHKLRILHGVNRVVARIYHHVDVLAPSQLPGKGPAIVVCNHTSALDPLLIQSACPRVITWMMAREYYNQPLLRDILDVIGVIPVSRGERDSAATRAALRALDHGEILGLFPEGRIETTRDLLPFQPGIAVLALKSEAPIYPAYLDGSQRGLEIAPSFIRRQRAVLTFGPPLRFRRDSPAAVSIGDVTRQIESAVAALRDRTRNHC